MLTKYNFKPSRPESIRTLLNLLKDEPTCTDVRWDCELKFYDTVFPSILNGSEVATFRAASDSPTTFRLPAAVELPVVITKENDTSYRHIWGTMQLRGFWGGRLADLPRICAKMNNAPSYTQFIDDALHGYCEKGGMDHLVSFYLLGQRFPGKIIAVDRPSYHFA